MGRSRGSRGYGRTDLFPRRADRRRRNRTGRRWACAGGEFFERAEGVDGEDMGSAGDRERFEIAADQDCGGGVVLDEHYFCCTTANRFDANGAGAGEDVEEARTADVGTEDVEEGFAQAVAGGAEGVA